MRLSVGDKAFRVIRFLLGLRNPRIATALAGYGFKQQDMAEGWTLINALGKGKLALLPSEPRDMETLLKLDAWENQWFPIAQAALDRRFPDLSGKFFLNLVQTEGPGVALSVGTFVDRYDELTSSPAKYGADAPKAVQLLADRGLTAAVVQEARALLTALTQVTAPAEPPPVVEQEAQLTAAEDAMWAWYLEWSQIARVAIKQRGLLKELGFLNVRRATEDDTVDPPVPDPITPTTGAPNGGAQASAAARA